jgi:hypothetical protein
MTTIYLLSAYVALTLAFWAHALRGLRAHDRSRRRQRLFGVEERVLIALVALLASSAWIVLLPMAGAARAFHLYERRGIARLMGQTRPRVVAGGTAQRAA